MQIFGPFRLNPAQPIQNSEVAASQQNGSVDRSPASNFQQPVDELDLSTDALTQNRIRDLDSQSIDGIRFEKVAELRHQIQSGTYESADKIDAALDRFLDHYA